MNTTITTHINADSVSLERLPDNKFRLSLKNTHSPLYIQDFYLDEGNVYEVKGLEVVAKLTKEY